VVTHRLRRDDRPRSLWVRGFRTTNVERTLLDLFSVLPRRGAELALEDPLRRRLTTLDRLWDLYREVGGPGRNGSDGLRKSILVHDHRDGSLAGRMEASLIRILRSLPVPPAAAQHEVRIGDDRFFIDFAYPDEQLGIEAHSLMAYGAREMAARPGSRSQAQRGGLDGAVLLVGRHPLAKRRPEIRDPRDSGLPFLREVTRPWRILGEDRHVLRRAARDAGFLRERALRRRGVR
jgi:hypothetical protein